MPDTARALAIGFLLAPAARRGLRLEPRPSSQDDGNEEWCLHTLVRNDGLIMSLRRGRWLTATELLTSLGLPISLEAQAWAAGAQCQFSRGFGPKPSTRTCRTMAGQAGNAMHVNSIGAVHAIIILKLAGLGRQVVPDSAASSNVVLTSSRPCMLKRISTFEAICDGLSAAKRKKLPL